MHRRVYNPSEYEYLQHLEPLSRFITTAALILGAVQLLFVFNFFKSYFAGKKAPANPWEVGTLEWTTPTPIPHYNFKEIPVVFHGPHEFNNPRQQGKDWIGQAERLQGDPSAAERTARTQLVEQPAH
jgi:cytochrome c oxidase subunit 1